MKALLASQNLKMWRDITSEAKESVAIPDGTQFEIGKYFDPKSTPEKPIWYAVMIEYIQTLEYPISLIDLRTHSDLVTLKILAPGNRLSITPVTEKEWSEIEKVLGL